MDADNVVVGGHFEGTGLRVDGEFLLEHAQIGGFLSLRSASLRNPGGWALAGGGLIVDSRMWCHEGLTAVGEVRLIGARIGGGLQISGAHLDNPSQTALNLDRATLGDVDATSITANGTISLAGSRLTGHLNLADASLVNAAGVTLVADEASISDTVDLTHVTSAGEIMMKAVHVGGRILFHGTTFECPQGTALSLSQSDASDVLCENMTATRTVRLTEARIARYLQMTAVRFTSPGKVALDARACQAGEFSLLPAAPVQGDVVLEHARFGIFRDDPSCWPSRLHLDGLSYDVLEPRLSARQRLAWLASGIPAHQPQPFDQLAAFYNRVGDPGNARRVLLAKERDQRHAKTLAGRMWSLLQSWTVGYGYQPWLAVFWFLAFLTIGSVAYSAAPPRALTSATTPQFNALAYTLDLLLPLVNLGQRQAFSPVGFGQWLSYFLIAAGWILATTIAAAITRILRRQWVQLF